MGIVKASFKNIAGTPQRKGSVTYRVPRQRTAANGEHIVTVVEHIVPISSTGTADSPALEQGVADVVIRIGTHQREYKINVPEADEDLQKLIDEYEPLDPPIVSLVKEYRDEMISTREAVETSLQHYGGVLTNLTERAENAAARAEEAEGNGGGELPDESVTTPKLSPDVQASLGKAESASQPGHAHTGSDVTVILDTEEGPVEVGMDIIAWTIGAVVETLRDKVSKDSAVFTAPVEMPGVKITGGDPGVGKVLTSDGSGVGSWQSGGAAGLKVMGPYLAGAPNSVGPVADPSQTNSTPYGNVLIGTGSNTSSNVTVVIGHNSFVLAQGGTAVGDGAGVGGGAGGATAVGRFARANQGSSTALGANASTTKMNQVMLGTNLQVVTMPNKAEIGEGTTMVTLSTRLTAGKAELVAQFATGGPIVIATQP